MLQTYDNYEIEDLGVQEEWVYDIEVEGNHNFFGNNILVHNSIYFTIEPFMEKIIAKNPGLGINEYVELADQFEKKVIAPIVQKTITDFSDELNAYNRDMIGCEREVIADCVAPNSTIKIKSGDETETLTISKFFNKFSKSHPQTKEQEIFDISDLNYQILSYNEDTGEKELKRILNVQKKITSKQLLDVISPTGKIITVTEDHKFAINVNGSIIWKEARYIDENDDVILYDNTFYNKENCELYGIEYVNHGSKNCDLLGKGKQISKTKTKRSKISKDKNTRNVIKRLTQFHNKIPPELIGHVDNLMVIPKIENIKKRCNINFDYVNMKLFGEWL